MNDELGTRIKDQYENRTRYFLPRRTYTILRCDGKAFHSYTTHCKKPFDAELISDMNETTKYLCENIQGAKLGYVQSDEISILLTDFETPTTSAYFDGNVQKISSVAASMATAIFNHLRNHPLRSSPFQSENGLFRPAMFDCRCFTIPDWIEVYNYFVWRNQDAARNAVQMVARSLYSHKECTNKSSRDLVDMIKDKGIDWATYDESLKNGRILFKEAKLVPNTYSKEPAMVERHEWVVKPAWVFTKIPAALQILIPKYQ